MVGRDEQDRLDTGVGVDTRVADVPTTLVAYETRRLTYFAVMLRVTFASDAYGQQLHGTATTHTGVSAPSGGKR